MEQLQSDAYAVCAHAMNPKTSGALQTRERLYHVWYHHAHAKKHEKQFAIPDADVTQAVVDCQNHMQFLNLHMMLSMEMFHFLLPNSDERVGKEAARLSNEQDKKAKQGQKKPRQNQKTKGSAAAAGGNDDDDDEDVGNGRVPKWHQTHEEVWEELLAGKAMPADVKWTAQTINITPNRYKANAFYDSLGLRCKDILRMVDLASPLANLDTEMVVDLSELHVLDC